MQTRILLTVAFAIVSILLIVPVFGLFQTRPGKPHSQSAIPVETLISKAQSKGSVPVIVGVRVDFQPEGTLANPQAVQAQRDAISRAQDSLLRAMESLSVKSVQKFPYIPYLTMEVDVAGLAFLSAFPEVTDIKENVPEGLTPIEGVH